METGDDPGRPIAYQALAPGTPVHDREGRRVGTVKKVLADERADIFDGLVIETENGSRFVDAPDVEHCAEHRVELKLTAVEVAAQPRHEQSAPSYRPGAQQGGWQDLWRRISLRRLWRRD
jgi:hypothetical protein